MSADYMLVLSRSEYFGRASHPREVWARGFADIQGKSYAGIRIEEDFFERKDWPAVLGEALECVRRYATNTIEQKLSSARREVERAQERLAALESRR